MSHNKTSRRASRGEMFNRSPQAGRLRPFFLGKTTPKDRAGIRQVERRNAKRSHKQRATSEKARTT